MIGTVLSREHDKQDKEKLHIFVNRRKFDADQGVKPTMTGAEVAGLVGVPADNAVVRLESGADQHEIAAEETVRLKNGLQFLVTRRTVEGGHAA